MQFGGLSVEKLSYTYPDGNQAIVDVSFRVPAGGSLAVIGANGAGKSTLLRHLNGTSIPRAGEVRIGDTAIGKDTIEAVRRTVGMVFADPDDQLFMSIVREDVAFGPLNLGLPHDEVDARVDEALESVEARHLQDRSTFRLSSGEKRRVAIATVLAMRPQILVLDEPTAGLDPKARRNLIALLGSLDHTLILATHDLDFAAELCVQTIVLSKGRIVADGESANILADRQLLESHDLELPLSSQTCRICASSTLT